VHEHNIANKIIKRKQTKKWWTGKQTQTQKPKCFKHQTRKHKIGKSQKLWKTKH